MADPTMTGRYKIDTSEVQGAHDEMLRTIQDTLGQINQTSSREFSKATRTVRGALMDVAVVAGTVDPALGLVVREMAKMRDVTSPLAKGLLWVERTVVSFVKSGLGIFIVALGAAAYGLYRLYNHLTQIQAEKSGFNRAMEASAKSITRLKDRIDDARKAGEDWIKTLDKWEAEETWLGRSRETLQGQQRALTQLIIDQIAAFIALDREQKQAAQSYIAIFNEIEKIRKTPIAEMKPRKGPYKDWSLDQLNSELVKQKKVMDDAAIAFNYGEINLEQYRLKLKDVEDAIHDLSSGTEEAGDALDGFSKDERQGIEMLQSYAEQAKISFAGMIQATREFCEMLGSELTRSIIQAIQLGQNFSDFTVSLMRSLMEALLGFAMRMLAEYAFFALAKLVITIAEATGVISAEAAKTAAKVIGDSAKMGWIGVVIGVGLAAAAVGALYALTNAEMAKAKKSMSDIPKYGLGGFVASPHLAIVGERPEVITPWANFERLIAPRTGNTEVHFEFNGREFARALIPHTTKIIKQQVRMQ